jgi:hypothetical protein
MFKTGTPFPNPLRNMYAENGIDLFQPTPQHAILPLHVKPSSNMYPYQTQLGKNYFHGYGHFCVSHGPVLQKHVSFCHVLKPSWYSMRHFGSSSMSL